MAVIILYIHQKSKRPNARRLPEFLRKIFIEKIAFYLGLTKQVDALIKRLEKREKNLMVNRSIGDFSLVNENLSQSENETELVDIWRLQNTKKEVLKKSNENPTRFMKHKSTQQDRKSTKSIKKKKDSLSHLISHEWLLFSLVLDRFFFYIFITLTVLSYLTTLYIFPTLIQMDKTESMIKIY
jgi:hypothetical protein